MSVISHLTGSPDGDESQAPSPPGGWFAYEPG